jgi:hypothetical protein
MVAVLRFFRVHCLFVPLCLSCRAIKLELFKRPLAATVSLLEFKSTFGFWMNSMNFDELIQLQVLKHKASLSMALPRLIDHLVDEHPEMRQMCAKVSPQLYAALEECCNFLDLSKRAFIEAAVSDGHSKAQIQIGNALDQDEVK